MSKNKQQLVLPYCLEGVAVQFGSNSGDTTMFLAKIRTATSEPGASSLLNVPKYGKLDYMVPALVSSQECI